MKTSKNKTFYPYKIDDKNLFKAVSFARKLRQDYPSGLAIHIAAKHYEVSRREVAREMGKIGSWYRDNT